MCLFQAAFDICLDKPFFANLSVSSRFALHSLRALERQGVENPASHIVTMLQTMGIVLSKVGAQTRALRGCCVKVGSSRHEDNLTKEGTCAIHITHSGKFAILDPGL